MGELIGPKVERAFATLGLILYRGELNGICGKEGRSGSTRIWAKSGLPIHPLLCSSGLGERKSNYLIKIIIRKQHAEFAAGQRRSAAPF